MLLNLNIFKRLTSWDDSLNFQKCSKHIQVRGKETNRSQHQQNNAFKNAGRTQPYLEVVDSNLFLGQCGQIEGSLLC